MPAAPRVLAAGALLALTACSTPVNTSVPRDRGASGFFESTPTIAGPKANRCEKLPKSALKTQCSDALFLAQSYVRRLSAADAVCLEGGFGHEPTPACLARAAVSDAAPNLVLLEIRDARPDSRWFKNQQHQIWFEESALVDLYLAESGY